VIFAYEYLDCFEPAAKALYCPILGSAGLSMLRPSMEIAFGTRAVGADDFDGVKITNTSARTGGT
jgi:hypothetical protein